MRTYSMCGWCHRLVETTVAEGVIYCPDCGHAVSLSRLECNCPRCRGQRSALAITEGDALDALNHLRRKS